MDADLSKPLILGYTESAKLSQVLFVVMSTGLLGREAVSHRALKSPESGDAASLSYAMPEEYWAELQVPVP